MSLPTAGSVPMGQARLLSGLSARALAKLEARCSRRKLGKGEMLITRDDDDDDVFFVLSGMLRVSIYAPSGKVLLLRDLGAGETLGELAAIDRKPRSASVEAIGAAEVVSMPGEVFRTLVTEEPTVAMALLRQSIGYIRELSERVYEVGALAVANRIHAELLRLAREAGGDANAVLLTPAPRNIDIANRISANREAVSRELTHLARLGIVQRRRRSLAVLDVARLAQLVNKSTPR